MPTHSQLTEAQRTILQRTLQAQMDTLQRQSRMDTAGLSQAEHAADLVQEDADDATQRAGDHEVEAIVSDIDSGEFAALQAALQRIQGPDYGVCADCGRPIPFARLSAEPQALRCTACAAEHERHA